MRFQVPQFIEVEDKIFGPLTIKQFIYVGGAVGMAIILYVAFPLFIAILLGVPVLALGAALSFYEINNKPLIGVLEDAFYYYMGNKLYTWEKPERKPEEKAVLSKKQQSVAEKVASPQLTQNKLKDLAWSLDVQESIYSEEHGRK